MKTMLDRNALFALALVALMSAPAEAGRLKPAGVTVSVARSPMQVTPSIAWNKAARPGRNSESWTLDGLTINELTFYGGIADGKTLFREVDKVNQPLPRFSKTMLIPDIAQMWESSYRVATGSPLVTVETMEPMAFAGHPGFRFTYSFAMADEVKRRGEARGAIIGGALYMISFEAPRIHYFDRDRAAFVAVADSARVVAR